MKRKPTPVRMTKRERLGQLKAYLNICFGLLSDYKSSEVADLTGLSVSTINRVSQGDVSLAIRWGTVEAIGLAAGLKLQMTEYSAKLRLVRPA